jgi:hypothetical protein
VIKLVDYVSTHAGGPSITLENISDTIGKIRMVMDSPNGVSSLLQFASKNIAAVGFDIDDDLLDGTLDRYYLDDYTIDDINPETQDYDSMRSGVVLWSPRTESSSGLVPMELRYTNTFRKLGGASLILSVCWANHNFTLNDTLVSPALIGPTDYTADDWVLTRATTVYFPSPSPPPLTVPKTFYVMSGMSSQGMSANVSSFLTSTATLTATTAIPSGTTVYGQMTVNSQDGSSLEPSSGTYSRVLSINDETRKIRVYKFTVTTTVDLSAGDVITELRPATGDVQLLSMIAFTYPPVDVPVNEDSS